MACRRGAHARGYSGAISVGAKQRKRRGGSPR
jgi:hypothetical protein